MRLSFALARKLLLKACRMPRQNWANLPRASCFVPPKGKWKMAANGSSSNGAAYGAQEIALLIRNVASLSMHYLNLKARYSQAGRQAGSAHVPCFSFINLAENSFIKLSAAIIYAHPTLPSPFYLSLFRCGSCAGATKIIANYRREEAAKCVAENAS